MNYIISKLQIVLKGVHLKCRGFSSDKKIAIYAKNVAYIKFQLETYQFILTLHIIAWQGHSYNYSL